MFLLLTVVNEGCTIHSLGLGVLGSRVSGLLSYFIRGFPAYFVSHLGPIWSDLTSSDLF